MYSFQSSIESLLLHKVTVDMVMSNEINEKKLPVTRPYPRCSQMVVCMGKTVVMFGGVYDRTLSLVSLHVIWLYNLDVERWRKVVLSEDTDVPPSTCEACAVVIGNTIFLHGGATNTRDYTDAMWKLTMEGNLSWTEVTFDNPKKIPSPRCGHSSWVHEDKLWIFGGFGLDISDFLHGHGDFVPTSDPFIEDGRAGYNNQLLCFDPNSEEWHNMAYHGVYPIPSDCHGTTKIKDIIWMYGGGGYDHGTDDLY